MRPTINLNYTQFNESCLAIRVADIMGFPTEMRVVASVNT